MVQGGTQILNYNFYKLHCFSSSIIKDFVTIPEAHYHSFKALVEFTY